MCIVLPEVEENNNISFFNLRMSHNINKMLDLLFLFLCLGVFFLCQLRESMREKSVITSYNQSGNVHSHELGTVQQEVQESKLDTNICKIVKHLEEEQKVLFQHLKKALAFGDEMQVAYSFSEKKVMRLERELDDKENEAIRTLQKLGKKEDLVFCLSERNNYYKREVHRLLLENSSLRQRVELLSKEVQEWKNKFDLPIYESSSRHKCQEDIRINPWNQVACNTEEVCTESQEESSIVTRL